MVCWNNGLPQGNQHLELLEGSDHYSNVYPSCLETGPSMWEGLSESLSPFYVSKVQNERSKFHSMEGVGREVRIIEYINISSTSSENLSLDMKYGKISRVRSSLPKQCFWLTQLGCIPLPSAGRWRSMVAWCLASGPPRLTYLPELQMWRSRGAAPLFMHCSVSSCRQSWDEPVDIFTKKSYLQTNST